MVVSGTPLETGVRVVEAVIRHLVTCKTALFDTRHASKVQVTHVRDQVMWRLSLGENVVLSVRATMSQRGDAGQLAEVGRKMVRCASDAWQDRDVLHVFPRCGEEGRAERPSRAATDGTTAKLIRLDCAPVDIDAYGDIGAEVTPELRVAGEATETIIIQAREIDDVHCALGFEGLFAPRAAIYAWCGGPADRSPALTLSRSATVFG